MAIQVSNPKQIPAVTYDKIHLMGLTINQPTMEDATLQPMYDVRISYMFYGVVGSVNYYDTKSGLKHISISDYLGEAIAQSELGDMDMLNALQSIESAVASIITDKDGIQSTVA